jgi:hypothetical protein
MSYSKIKKNKKTMLNEERLIQLMENFKGQQFQWVKTNRPELLGKTVKCRNIEPRGNRFFAVFDDGSSIDTDQLNSSLFMITEDMQPLTRAEVEAIAGPSRVQPKPRVQPVNSQITDSVTQGAPHVEPTPRPQVASMFEMFDSSDRDIQLGVTVKLPDQDFLAMLHSNAKDKDKFMDELTEYVFRVINKKVVKDSITKMFETSTSTQRSGEINFTEIHE